MKYALIVYPEQRYPMIGDKLEVVAVNDAVQDGKKCKYYTLVNTRKFETFNRAVLVDKDSKFIDYIELDVTESFPPIYRLPRKLENGEHLDLNRPENNSRTFWAIGSRRNELGGDDLVYKEE